MIEVDAATSRHRWARVACVAAVCAGLVLGGTGIADASTAPAADATSCLKFSGAHWYSTKQKVVGKNICSTGTYSFQVHDWAPGGIDEYSDCYHLAPGESAGWEFPRLRPYKILHC